MKREDVLYKILHGTPIYCKTIKEMVASIMFFQDLKIPNVHTLGSSSLYDLDVLFLKDLKETPEEYMGLALYAMTGPFNLRYIRINQMIQNPEFITFGNLGISTDITLRQYIKHLLINEFDIFCSFDYEVCEIMKLLDTVCDFDKSQPYLVHGVTDGGGKQLWDFVGASKIGFSLNSDMKLQYHMSKKCYKVLTFKEVKDNYTWIINN